MLALHSVTGAKAGETVPLHDTRETLALARGNDIDQGTCLEHLGSHFLPELIRRRVSGPDLDQVAPRRHSGLTEVPGQRLVDLAGIDGTETELDRVVPILVRSADQGHDTGPGLDNRDRHETVRLVPDLGHPELLAQDSLPFFRGHCSFVP